MKVPKNSAKNCRLSSLVTRIGILKPCDPRQHLDIYSGFNVKVGQLNVQVKYCYAGLEALAINAHFRRLTQIWSTNPNNKKKKN